MTNQRRGSSKLFQASRNTRSPEGKRKGKQVDRAKPRRGSARPESLEARPAPEAQRRPPRPKGPPGAQRLDACVPAFQALRKKALAFAGTYEDFALGETLVKLKNKNIVVALGRQGGGLSVSCKLPKSGAAAVTRYSFASPAAFGLGKSGWVTAKFQPGDDVPLRMLLGWIEESHAAVLPAPRPTR